MDDKSVAVCFSNNDFMFGHFIEVHWNNNWIIESKWIC